jgi:hypothetical protein
MNHMSLLDAAQEINDGDLLKIPAFLGQRLMQKARVAQSVIIRSEGILFGTSIPRFAIRVYLEGGGFINCRRLNTFVENSHYDGNTEWGNRYQAGTIAEEQRNQDLDGTQLEHKTLAEVLEGQSCIGDSLLCEPQRLKKDHFSYIDISAARLFDSYGESRSLVTNDGPFIPYIRSVNLGGGLCAQAVCFMATAALANHASKVCGVAEITALAHEDNCLELSLGGLTPEKMQNYFSRVNLRLSEQASTPIIQTQLLEEHKREFFAGLSV